jgi:hypothetical protein
MFILKKIIAESPAAVREFIINIQFEKTILLSDSAKKIKEFPMTIVIITPEKKYRVVLNYSSLL